MRETNVGEKYELITKDMVHLRKETDRVGSILTVGSRQRHFRHRIQAKNDEEENHDRANEQKWQPRGVEKKTFLIRGTVSNFPILRSPVAKKRQKACLLLQLSTVVNYWLMSRECIIRFRIS